MNSDSVRQALKKAGKRPADLARHMSISRQEISNKLHDDTWSINDIARVAAFTGGELEIAYPDGEVITFTDDSIVTEQIRTLKNERRKQKSAQEQFHDLTPDPENSIINKGITVANENAVDKEALTAATSEKSIVEKAVDITDKKRCKKKPKSNTHNPSIKSEQLSIFQYSEILQQQSKTN